MNATPTISACWPRGRSNACLFCRGTTCGLARRSPGCTATWCTRRLAPLTQAYAAVDRQTSGVKFAEINRDRYQHLYSLQMASQEEAQRAEQQLKQAQQDLAPTHRPMCTWSGNTLSELLQVSPSTLTPGNLYTKELIPVRARRRRHRNSARSHAGPGGQHGRRSLSHLQSLYRVGYSLSE